MSHCDAEALLTARNAPEPLALRGTNAKEFPILSWDESYDKLKSETRGSDFDGVVVEYLNPVTGGSIMPTIGAQLQLLRPKEETRGHRHTGSAIYQVAKGCGWSVIDGQRFARANVVAITSAGDVALEQK